MGGLAHLSLAGIVPVLSSTKSSRGDPADLELGRERCAGLQVTLTGVLRCIKMFSLSCEPTINKVNLFL